MESVEGSNETHGDEYQQGIRIRIYQAIETLRLPVDVVKENKDARENLWIEVSKRFGNLSREEFDIALKKVIFDVSGFGISEEMIAVHNAEATISDYRKQKIKARFKDFAHTPLKLLNSKDLHHEFWLKLCVYYGTDKELFEKELIECLHEEYGYNIDSLSAMKSTAANAGEL